MLWLTLGAFLAVFVHLIMNSDMAYISKPNADSPPPVPSIMWKLYDQRMGRTGPKIKQELCFIEEFNVPGSVVRVFTDQGQFVPPSSGLTPNLCLEKRLYFNLSVLEIEEKVTMGQLELRFTQNTYYGQIFEFRLYRILRLSLKEMDRQETSRKLLIAQTFRLLHKSIYFNLTDVCQIWRKPHKNLGLALEILHKREGTLDQCQRMQTILYTSLLIVSLNPLQCNKRRKKRSYDNPPFTASNICQKRRLYIEFRDVGWQNLVIAPQGYMANSCSGDCPYPLIDLLNGTNHAILQTLVHSVDPENVPLPYCVPTKMSSISMLFYDINDNVVLQQYENMAVDECGCR